MKNLKLKPHRSVKSNPNAIKSTQNPQNTKFATARSNPGTKTKSIEVNFDGGKLTSDAGVVLLQKVVESNIRNRVVAEDVLDAYNEGRKIIVLTERTDHLDRF